MSDDRARRFQWDDGDLVVLELPTDGDDDLFDTSDIPDDDEEEKLAGWGDLAKADDHWKYVPRDDNGKWITVSSGVFAENEQDSLNAIKYHEARAAYERSKPGPNSEQRAALHDEAKAAHERVIRFEHMQPEPGLDRSEIRDRLNLAREEARDTSRVAARATGTKIPDEKPVPKAPKAEAKAEPKKDEDTIVITDKPKGSIKVPEKKGDVQRALVKFAKDRLGVEINTTKTVYSSGLKMKGKSVNVYGFHSWMDGRNAYSAQMTRDLVSAIDRTRLGGTLNRREAEAIESVVHENLHGAGPWKATGKQVDAFGAVTNVDTPAIEALKAVNTSVGKILEEGSTEFLAVREYPKFAEAMGMKLSDNPDERVYRSPVGADHSYMTEVGAVEALVHIASGDSDSTIGKNLSPKGEEILKKLNYEWRPLDRPKELAKLMAEAYPAPDPEVKMLRETALTIYIESTLPQRYVKGISTLMGGAGKFNEQVREELLALATAPTKTDIYAVRDRVWTPVKARP